MADAGVADASTEQAYYKQAPGAQGGQPAFYPATIAATHPYAGLWPGQPLMHGAPFYYGGMLPYGYPPAPVAVSGAEGEAGADASAPAPGSPSKRDAAQQGTSQPGSAKTGSPGAVNLQDMSAGQSGQNGQAQSLDDREMKRQKRKQSNRESARRSRLRKQSECEELAVRVKELVSENARLKEHNRELQMKLDKLTGGGEQQGLGELRQDPGMQPGGLVQEHMVGRESEAADALRSVATANMHEPMQHQHVAPLPPQPAYQPGEELRQVAV
ncbi:hypothetical protein WJX72_005027 [[Myrmecia] bisecta]|uniref:BZIP domain-containing protein n=1 Tax=[Myrmecia] bisecta TaxID=41462 RepID=A0AAW1R6F0_9CHLO